MRFLIYKKKYKDVSAVVVSTNIFCFRLIFRVNMVDYYI